MREMILAIIGVLVAIVFVGGIILPYMVADTTRPTAVLANTSALTTLNAGTNNHILYTVTPYELAASVVVVYQRGGTETVTLTDTDDNLLCTMDNTTPDTCSIPSTLAGTSPLTLKYVSTGALSNITSSTLTYTQLATSDGWNANVTILWGLVGLVLVAAIILFVMKF